MRFIWVCKRIRENYEMTNYYNDNDARPSAHTNFFILYYISLYKLVFVSKFKQYLTDQELQDDHAETAHLHTEDTKPWTGSNQRLPAARHTGNSTLKIRPHTTSEAIALRCEGQTAASSGQMSWTRDGTASFERLYTGSSMRPAWKLPVKVSLCLKKCFMCVSSGWKCLI